MSSYAYAWHGSTLLLLGGVDASWWFSVGRDAHRGLRRPRLGHGPSWRLGQGIHHSAWVSAFAFGPAVHHGTAELVAMWQSGFTWRGPWTATDPLWLLSLLPCMPCTTRARAPPARAALREGAEGDAHLWHGRPINATHRRCVECVTGRSVQRQRLGLEPRTWHESVGFHSMGMASPAPTHGVALLWDAFVLRCPESGLARARPLALCPHSPSGPRRVLVLRSPESGLAWAWPSALCPHSPSGPRRVL